jgi:hypothetical protein
MELIAGLTAATADLQIARNLLLRARERLDGGHAARSLSGAPGRALSPGGSPGPGYGCRALVYGRPAGGQRQGKEAHDLGDVPAMPVRVPEEASVGSGAAALSSMHEGSAP